MKILYISSVPLPSTFANRLQVAKMSEAFSKQSDFTLCLSTIKTSKQDVFEHYNISTPFKIIELGGAREHLRTLLYGIKAIRVTKKEKPDFLFIREAPLAFFLSFFFKNVIFEVHDFPENKFFLYKILFKRVYKIISTNKWKADKISEVFGIHLDKILHTPNGVEVDYFLLDSSKEEARKKLNLPLDKKLVIYTGSLFSWKGGDVLLRAEEFLSNDFRIIFVGGTKEDQVKIKTQFAGRDLGKIVILPHQPHPLIRHYLSAADVLVLPNTAKEDIAKFYTSPIKLFEYMSSKKPIVCSDLPSIREIVDENDVLFFKPDDPRDLASKIMELESKKTLQENLTGSSFLKIRGYSWDERVRKILAFIKK